MTVVVSSELRSTSDTYNGFDPPLVETPAFGTPCRPEITRGFFSNLHRGTVVEVADGGSARFWIEFELGKFLFPLLEDNLDLLEPAIVQAAQQVFGIEFVQGCHWIP
jgi:hypothetical protein